MTSIRLSPSEKKRLNNLNDLNILDTQPNPRLDALVQLASQIAQTPIALISLVDANRQWFKSKVGLEESETPRDISFCTHAIENKDQLFEIPDALADERFKDNPLVTQEPSIRYYAGHPLKTSKGFNIGTLCVIDTKSNKLTETQRTQIETIAHEIICCIEDRAQISQLKSDLNAKSAFVASMSHELRTPLTSVIGFTDVLSEIIDKNPIDIKKAKENLNILKSSSEYLVDLIGDILDFSKLEAKKFNQTKETFSLNKLLKQVYNTLQVQAEKFDVDFSINQSVATPELIYGDPTLLKQVIINLANNAIKFSNGESVKVNLDLAKSKDDFLRIDFIDTGIGMTPEEVERVFKPFVQANKSIAKKFDGTGLGLAISKEIIDLLGGKIYLVKSEKNIGTHFAVEIPYIEKEALPEDEDTSTKVPKNIDLDDKRILIIDDVKENRFLLRHYLKDYDLSFKDAINGEDAIKKFNSDFDYIFLDMQLPDLNGIEIFKILQPKLQKHQKVIAFTASSTAEGIKECLEIGFHAYLTKPFTTEDILDSIKFSLSK
ncbi:MAG: hypothetical protein CME63_03485 [Halobacteriovoraceae bacterium]|nr:hypothetical protein [Halobacteriovoraceae bacterium]|tara:strand:+ start:78803 stop:80443 length:1641 start_codon:yes stop_codon:yes gene_type:complete